MTTAAEQYRALVARLESIQEAPVDPRSPEERDSQMAAVKGAYQDYQDAEEKKNADALKTYGDKFTAQSAPTSPVSGDVKKIQTLLNAKGANLTVDGKLGANTLAAIVKHLESEQGQAGQPPKWSIDGQPVSGKEPQWSIDGKPVTNTQGPSTPVGAVSNQPQDPFAKGGLFNR